MDNIQSVPSLNKVKQTNQFTYQTPLHHSDFLLYLRLTVYPNYKEALIVLCYCETHCLYSPEIRKARISKCGSSPAMTVSTQACGSWTMVGRRMSCNTRNVHW